MDIARIEKEGDQMPVTRYQKLRQASKAAAARLRDHRQPLRMQLPVYRYYDFGLRRGADPVLMGLWQLNYVMRFDVEGSPRRYPLLMSMKGELVGYVQHIALTANHSRQTVETLSVLDDQHFDHLDDAAFDSLLSELYLLAGKLSQVAS
ncbi:hypothetical protein CL689_05160 [Candidatus Saccharibacteria bacterium]|nr:hypothetical protein [Candidatus Saccharibacteria bacterium]MBJ58707.1 hypothetical protein [Candidatus Saccharibacteria bacterium]MBQ69431.1 hypothetical protein [Candidatus Saccharibacteria bacterium]|tara:strand:+ start:638 stop:1084 length:447 start_codon:yes stop_codon:yes gene_type:complete